MLIMKRQRTLFESFDCEEEGANKRSNRDLKDCEETQHNTISVNQPRGPTTVVVNSCKPLSEVSKLGELSSLREVRIKFNRQRTV